MITKKEFIYLMLFVFFIIFFFIYLKPLLDEENKETPISEYVFTKDKIYRVTEDYKLVDLKQSDIEYLKSRITLEEVKLTVSEMDSIRILINKKY